MSRVLPILFNTEMVQATLDGRKTVTRRVVKGDIILRPEMEHKVTYLPNKPRKERGCEIKSIKYFTLESFVEYETPYHPGDILYVRQTWAFIPCISCNGDHARPGSGMACYDTQAVEYDDGDNISDGCFVYRADCPRPERITWRPSIHMPKAAARIWLQVTDVKIQRLHEMTLDDFLREGVVIRTEAFNDPENAYRQARAAFIDIWDSTIPKGQQGIYGWATNPLVWVIEFERRGQPEPCVLEGIEPAEYKRPCIGYGKSNIDDEPCEMCKGCAVHSGSDDFEQCENPESEE